MNEELQSTNEELHTINDEMRQRSAEVDHLNGFMASILASLRGGVVVVDPDLQVEVWSQQVRRPLGPARRGSPGQALPQPRHRPAGGPAPPAHPRLPGR